MSAKNRYLELFKLTKAYPNRFGEEVPVVKDFDLILKRGELVSLIGHSGCGKSTVLTMVAGLNSITSGGIVLDGHEVSGPGPDRSVVFQAPCLLDWMTALQNVKLGVDRCYPHASHSERFQICEYYLSAVGLGDYLDKYPRELSGGMQQRVGIARAVALKPKLLLLDEPFGRLDSLTRLELQEVILNLIEREKLTSLLITHDVDEALFMSDQVCMMTNGPNAKVGSMVKIPHPKPRDRQEFINDKDYFGLRAKLVRFLSEQEKLKLAPNAVI